MRYDKPVPVVRGEESLYFDAAREHRLVYQVCDDCKRTVEYPRASWCPHCGSTSVTLQESAGKGVVHSFTTQYRPGGPGFADDVPYSLVLVDLDEGARAFADIIDCDPDDLAIGAPVEVVFDDVTDELTLPRFRPSGEERS